MKDERLILALSEREAELVKRALVVLKPFVAELEEEDLRAALVELISVELDERANKGGS